ncbi:hypothetical protein ACYPKM_03750 [Pseudomonas aeruginosa]
MLSTIQFHRFGGIPQASWTLCAGINVVMGNPRSGKTRSLKAMHAILQYAAARSEGDSAQALVGILTHAMGVPDAEHLIQHRSGAARVKMELAGIDGALDFSFTEGHQEIVAMPGRAFVPEPCFLDAHTRTYESASTTNQVSEEPDYRAIAGLLDEAVGGEVIIKNGTCHVANHMHSQPASALGETTEKLALLSALIKDGSIRKGSTLILDCFDAAMHPTGMRHMADALGRLAKAGTQVVLASNSLFIARELEIYLAQAESIPGRTFGLSIVDGVHQLEQDDSAEGIVCLTLVDEELKQGDRFMASM